jgi:glycerol-3-phosphate O-acyltransferase/dihydroxyacetone phosphate acyltransferase
LGFSVGNRQQFTMAPEAAAAAAASSASVDLYPMVNWKYDMAQWFMSTLMELFFREIHPRGAWKVPKTGPVLFVAAPHANQFVDGAVLQRTIRQEAGRRVSQLIAQKSVHGIVGWLSRTTGSVPVGRAQDSAKPASGTVYLPDPVNDPALVRGIGTKFGEGDGVVGSVIFLPSAKKRSGANMEISQIIGPEEIRIKRSFGTKLAMEQLTGRTDIDEDGRLTNTNVKGIKDGYKGTKYKLAPHIDQTKVYEAVFARLRSGGCVGLFPEGGSHDRTELLPLKAGVAIMALGALADAPNIGLKIVPVGMNYFHAHKFRSRAVVEFGPPFEVPSHLVGMYKSGNRRDAIGGLLDMVYQSLNAVTVSAPDYDTLMLIQAARRLYNPTGSGKKLPLPVVVELNRRLALGYERYKSDTRIVELKEAVHDYNKQLRYLNLRDHQVQYAKMSLPRVVFALLYRITTLLVLSIAVLPGVILFSPVFIASKLISTKKAREALAGSTVKIQGRDVMATWKILVALVLTPTIYHFYSIILTLKTYQDRMWGHVPEWVPLWVVYFGAWPLMIAITFSALRFGEVGMDIFKSLRPLVVCLNPSSSYNIQQLRTRRAELSEKVTNLIMTLGPEMYPDDFDRFARMARARDGGSPESPRSERADAGRSRRDSEQSFVSDLETQPPPALSRSSTHQSSRALPRNDSFSNIGEVELFSTRPPSRARSRSRSSSDAPGLSALTTLDSSTGFDEASQRIREMMRQRRKKSEASVATDVTGDDDDSDYDEARRKDR